MFSITEEKLSVLISDDYQSVSEQIVNLSVLADLNIVGLVDQSEKAIEAYFRLKPDVVLLSYKMHSMNGIETARVIREGDANAQIIMFTGVSDAGVMASALSAGVRGICLSDTDTERIRVGIDCVVRGEVWLDENLLEIVMNGELVSSNDTALTKDKALEKPVPISLSDRELSVLKLVSEGYSNKRIAKSCLLVQKQ